MKVFLGGTVNGSDWRDRIIPELEIDYFNPVVKEWDDAAYQRELYERQYCDFCLYVITPKLTGFYALAEVTDDSYKRPDRTLYCFLEKDEDTAFSEEEIESLNILGEQVRENGGNWLHTLDDVVRFLNSGKALHISNQDGKNEFDDVFISYGRRHSKAFATKLHDALIKDNYSVWFDQNDIPLGVDFQEQINEGIANAHNFVFIISPHSIRSEYCLKEIEMALSLNKRIIPLLHVEPTDELDNIHPAIAKINWIYIREEADENKELFEWKQIDDFEVSFQGLLQSIGNHASYVEMHTRLLVRALNWEKNQRSGKYLLVGKDRQDAEKWLAQEFLKGQPPCVPTDLHCEYICESKKNGENLMTEAFIAYAVENKEFRDNISKQLSRFGVTTWVHTKDIKTGQNYEKAINDGIAQADNFILFLSKESIDSDYCKKEIAIALKYNKRIIPILTEALVAEDIPQSIRDLQYIDFSEVENNTDFKDVYQEKVARILSEINKEKGYYSKHKRYLAQAIKWEEQGRNESLLLRGYNLQDAEAWLEIGKKREEHKPTDLHDTFITASGIKRMQLSNEVFISYSRADSDFARKLNDALQLQGKTTWFDQESITSGADFQQEIYRGIESSDNFIFVISPEAIKSPYCSDEVEYAASLNKRFITILHRKTEYLHPTLAAVHWIDFEKNDFTESFNDLVSVLDIDRDYIQQHTKWSQRALTWEEQGKNPGLLLAGLELDTASTWLKHALKSEKKPVPTTLLKDFIKQSEVANSKEKKRKMIMVAMIIVMAGLLVVAGAMAYLANRERKQAEKAEDLALSEKQVADSLRNKAVADKNLADSLRIQAEIERHKADSLRNIAEENEKMLAKALEEAQKAQIAANKAEAVAKEEAQKAKLAAEKARVSEEKAREQSIIALQKEEEAQKARQLAEQRLIAYQEQKNKAEEAQVAYQEQKATVDKITMLSAASQLATASQNEFNNGNVEVAKVLGLHAYYLNEQFTSSDRDFLPLKSKQIVSLDSNTLINQKIHEKTGNVPEIFGALSTLYFYENEDISVGGKSPITTFAFSHKNAPIRQMLNREPSILAIADESGTVFIYRVGSNNSVVELSTFNLRNAVNKLVFNDDATQILAGTNSGEVYLLSNFLISKGSRAELAADLGEPVQFLEFIPDAEDSNKTFIAAGTNKVNLWSMYDQKTKSKYIAEKIYETKSNTITAMAVSTNTSKDIMIAFGVEDKINIYTITASKRGTPELFQKLSIGSNSKVRQYTAASVTALAFDKSAKILATGYKNGNIETWETETFNQVNSFFGHTGAIYQLSFNISDYHLVSASDDQTVRIWSSNPQENPLILKNENSVKALAVTSDSDYILTLKNENKVRFWPTSSSLLASKLCETITDEDLKRLPMKKVYEYAGIEFSYQYPNCVYDK